MFVTRLGFNAKAVITGDITQIDLPNARRSGLIEAAEVLKGVNGISFNFFDEGDVVRHVLVQRIIRAYDDPLADHFEDTRPAPTEATVAAEPASAGASVAQALSTALHLYPGSTLAALELPGAHAPWFAVRVRQAHDLRRVFGTTIVYVSSRSGRVLGNYDAGSMPLKTRLWDAVYALHTGEIGGTVGRCLVAIVGMWLSVMIGLGLSLWFLRRRVTSPGARAEGMSALRTDSGTR